MRKITAGKLAACTLCMCLMHTIGFGQGRSSAPGELNHPKVEFYAGYSYWHPIDAQISGIYFKDVKYGAEGSVTYFVKPWLGIQAEAGAHVDDVYDREFTGGVGVQLQTNLRKFTPFFHVLGGPAFFGGPANNGKKYGWNGTAGVGLDWVPLLRHEWFGLRLFQADYQYNYNDFGPLKPALLAGGTAKNDTFAGSAGVVIRLGGRVSRQMATQMTCSANRAEVFPGEPISVTSQLLGFNVMKPVQYTWTTTGGRILGAGGESLNIDTSGLPVGDYKVMGTAMQGKRANQQASCAAAFAIRQYEPPTVSCIASPASIGMGVASTVTATGYSPQNRPMTYTFSANGARINSTGNVATVTAQAAGDIVVTCGVQDDRAHSASANVTIPVGQPTATMATGTGAQASALAPLPLQNDMCTVSFERDRRRPVRVDNEAKACLDGIALSMQRDQDSTLVLIGDHTGRETIAVAAERGVNVKQYLTQEKGIDRSRIQVRAEDTGSARVQTVMLPVGATFNEEGQLVNESAVVHHGQAYGTPGSTVRRPTRRRRPARLRVP